MSLTKATYSMITGTPYNVLDYGADPTGQTDSTAAFQAAFNAAAADIQNSTGPISSTASVYVPQGLYYIAGTVEIQNRIGLFGDGSNTVITGLSPSTTSPSTCGFRFNAPTPKGIAPYIHHITFFGFTSGPCLDIEVSGAYVADCYFSSSQEAIRLSQEGGGGPCADVVISNIIFDQNLVDVSFRSAINTLVSDCISYLANTSMYFLGNGEVFGQGSSDIVISNCEFNYSRIASVFCDSAGGNKNIQIDGCSFMLNAQPSTFESFIYVGPNAGAAEFFVNGCVFRNWKDYAVKVLSDNVVSLVSSTFDATKTLGGYAQSSASTAIQLVGATIPTPVISCQFRNIQNYVVEASSNSVISFVGGYQLNVANFDTQDGTCTINVSGFSEQFGSNTGTSFDQISLRDIGTLRFNPLAADPGGAIAGDVYYNSGTNKLRCYNGTTWNDLF